MGGAYAFALMFCGTQTRGPIGDHTLCAMVNDLRVCARPPQPHLGHTPGDKRKRVTAIYWGSSGRRFN
jgi:hypothetical protein